MVGLSVFLGAKSTPSQAIVEIPGTALRMAASTFTDVVLRSDGALYYVFSFGSQWFLDTIG